VLLVAGLSAMVACAVIVSSVAVTARAQGAAHNILKLGEAAFNHGDYVEAATRFENAVRMEPNNVNAKLLLGNTLLMVWVPGSDAGAPVAARARQQYLDVLALEPGNKQALQSLASIALNSRQFAEAHDWAMKAIQVDPTDPVPYYTAGFLDWSMTYPDYAAARSAAGIRPEAQGPIPNATLRQSVREKHRAQIEDGHRVLATAMQLDPDFADAMAYENLLDRIEAGLADTPEQASEWTAKADQWVTKALDAKRRLARRPRPEAQGLNVDAPATFAAAATWTQAPPPPPPPPPPGQARVGGARADAPDVLHIAGEVQEKNLIQQTPPEYPAAARNAGYTGVVQLGVTIGKDGKVQDVRVLHAIGLGLDEAAVGAVKQWVYRPTLLNGEPVAVQTTVNVAFGR
jgi:TonB family protein